MGNATKVGQLLWGASQDVSVRFSVDCARRVQDLCVREAEAAELAERTLAFCEQWLEEPSDYNRALCGQASDALAVILSRWANDTQSMHNTAVAFALQACVRAGDCVGEELGDLRALKAAECAVRAKGLAPPTMQRAEIMSREQHWQLIHLSMLLWPELSGSERETAVMVVYEARQPADEAGALAIRLCAGAGR